MLTNIVLYKMGQFQLKWHLLILLRIWNRLEQRRREYVLWKNVTQLSFFTLFIEGTDLRNTFSRKNKWALQVVHEIWAANCIRIKVISNSVHSSTHSGNWHSNHLYFKLFWTSNIAIVESKFASLIRVFRCGTDWALHLHNVNEIKLLFSPRIDWLQSY